MPIIVASTTFFCFIIIGKNNVLDANIVFVSLAVFDIMRYPVIILPNVISLIMKAKVALTRITTFLLREEIDTKYSMLENSSSNVLNFNKSAIEFLVNLI